MSQLLRLNLTPRDKTILSTVLLFRIMKTSQISDLFFSTQRTGSNRLLELKKGGYLQSVEQRTRGFHSENIWMITRKGLAEAKEWLTYKRREFSARNLTVEPTMYAHDLQIVQVFVELVKRGICSVEDLMSGQFLDTRTADVQISAYLNKLRLRPDARFKKGDRWYWIEIDRGTERLSAITTKIQRYKAYLDTSVEGKHVVVFLTENGQRLSADMYRARIENIRWNAATYLGAYSLSERIEWYTFDIQKGLDVLCERLVTDDVMGQALKRLIHIALDKSEMEGYQLKRFDHEFIPSAPAPAAWLGLKGINDEGQFYIVENLMGGASGGLSRLEYFSIQQHEFMRIMGAKKPKLLLFVHDPMELEVVYNHHPQLLEDLMYITWDELFSEPFEIDWIQRGSQRDV